MGLDMYLERMPRYKNATASDISAVQSYLDWITEKAKGSEYANCTFKEWCGTEKEPPKEYIDFYVNFYKHQYYGFARIMEEIGYWRKANQIHNWFVEHVQNGEDDCCYHNEVTKEVLEELLDICEEVLASCELIDGKINNGYKIENGKVIPIMEDGKRVKDSSIAEELLPFCSGFFFGGAEYDEYYVSEIKETIDIVTKALETTDFEKEMIYYISSW